MLVLCVGMYRACSTWQYGVVGAILERHRSGQRLGFVEGIRFDEKSAENPRTSDWAVLKAHDYHARYGDLLAAGRARGIYSYRDLRDAISSYIHKTGTDLATVRERGFIELCIRNDRAWRAQPGMLVQGYRALIDEPARGVEEIAAHLGITLGATEAREIADELSLAATRNRVESLSARLREEGVNLVAQDLTRFDPVSLFHWNHIRATDPAAGPDAADLRQRAEVEQLTRPWLLAHGFEVDPTPGPAPAPAVRISYAPGAVDIRLDRFFGGTRGTVYDFDAPGPEVGNASYYLFLRGWRGLNIATARPDRAGFDEVRRGDINVVRPLGAPEGATRTLTDLVGFCRLEPPDLVILDAVTDAEVAVGAIVDAGWRPQVYVTPPVRARSGPAAWPDRLQAAGYRVVTGLTDSAIFVRDDLADAIPDLARPLGPADHFRPADPTVAALSGTAPAPSRHADGGGIGSILGWVGSGLRNLVRPTPAPADPTRPRPPGPQPRVQQGPPR